MALDHGVISKAITGNKPLQTDGKNAVPTKGVVL